MCPEARRGMQENTPTPYILLAIYPVGVYYEKGKQTKAIISEEKT
jgi:hypothetical protein